MLSHLNKTETKPSRVVILGGKGFVGSRTALALKEEHINCLSLGREELDLTKDDSSAELIKLLDKNDTLVFVSAKAPVKNEDMLIENILMAKNICKALHSKPVAHLIYISSDAVYTDSDKPLTENCPAEPASLHGAMHLTREIMLRNAFEGPLCILRPTLIFGDEDPHKGYGPNSFLRLVLKGQDIKLFGKGEEKRDHVWVEDVAEIILRAILNKSHGVLNVCTGTLRSFAEIAKTVIEETKAKSKIITSPRNGPMPHNGYREFDISDCKTAFPAFSYRTMEAWLQNSKLVSR